MSNRVSFLALVIFFRSAMSICMLCLVAVHKICCDNVNHFHLNDQFHYICCLMLVINVGNTRFNPCTAVGLSHHRTAGGGADDHPPPTPRELEN